MVLRPAGTGTDLLVRGGRLPDWPRLAPGERRDVRIAGGVIVEVGPDLEPAGEDLLEASGALVLPGLHDHHVHLRAMVAEGHSVAVGPADVGGAAGLAAALRGGAPDPSGWRRAVGYHESVAGELDRGALDALGPDGPLRVQHRSGVMWVVNSAGADALGLADVDLAGVERDGDGRPTGRLFRLDGWLAERLGREDPAGELGVVSDRLASRGVTGVTDATPGASVESAAALLAAATDGRLVQRLHLMCPFDLRLSEGELVTRGPHKIVLDDDRLPGLDDLAEIVVTSHAAGVPVAVHCVTAAQLVLAVTAFDAAGALRGDRIEHGSVIGAAMVPVIARLGLIVVTNPGFVHSRGDSYLDEVEDRDLPDLYRCASLLAAGVPVAAGTDAPFGPGDPWTAVRAAATRRTRHGRRLGASEAVSLEDALCLFSGEPARPGRRRRLAVREPGDLCVLSGTGLDHPVVEATVVAGRVVYRSR